MAGLLHDSYWFSTSGSLEIGQSLRFSGSQHLEYPGWANPIGNVYLDSFWIKRSLLTEVQTVTSTTVGAAPGDNSFDGNDEFTGRSVQGSRASNGVFRDPNAWYHIVIKTTGTSANQSGLLWVNGVLMNSNMTWSVRKEANVPVAIGKRLGTTQPYFFNGYIAEFHRIRSEENEDPVGSIDCNDFGQFNSQGVWVPKEYNGTHGTTGFYLDFSDPNNIGKDRSGNGFDFTPNGFDLTNTTDILYDYSLDNPYNNASLWNPLAGSTRTAFVLGAAQSQRETNNTFGQAVSSMQYPDGKLSYSEHYMGSVGADFGASPNNYVGVGEYIYGRNNSNQNGFTNGLITYYETGEIYVNGTLSSTRDPYTSNCTIGVKVDRRVVPNTVRFYLDGVAQGPEVSASNISTLHGFSYTRNIANPSNLNGNVYWKSGNFPWEYAPPGISFAENSVTSKNSEAQVIVDPRDHFDVVTATGANILSQAQSKFANGLWWIKDRQNSDSNQLMDSVRGGTTAVRSPNNNPATYSNPSGNSVAWCWATDSDGLNQTAGFQIITYTGNGVAGRTVAHGLGVAPDCMLIFADNSSNTAAPMYHSSLGASQSLNLKDSSLATNTTKWDNTEPTSTVFTLGSGSAVNGNGLTYVAYLWRATPGYSAFGTYGGNGSTDGPFVYTGFSPAMVWRKIALVPSGSSGGWSIHDAVRDPYNVTGERLQPNTTNAESFSWKIDMLSNGFKMRDNSGANSNGATHVYMAFAKTPFGGSNVAPATAR